MSRERNNWHRYVGNCLADRREIREWISRAQALTPYVHVTEHDWCRYGHLCPRTWLYERGLDEEDPRDDETWWKWGDETLGAPELEEWNDWPQHEIEGNDWRSLQQDWEEYQEPRDLEYGGRCYPMKHVRDARGMQGD